MYWWKQQNKTKKNTKKQKNTKKTQQNVILTKDLYMNQKVFISILYLSILIHYNVLTQLR